MNGSGNDHRTRVMRGFRRSASEISSVAEKVKRKLSLRRASFARRHSMQTFVVEDESSLSLTPSVSESVSSQGSTSSTSSSKSIVAILPSLLTRLLVLLLSRFLRKSAPVVQTWCLPQSRYSKRRIGAEPQRRHCIRLFSKRTTKALERQAQRGWPTTSILRRMAKNPLRVRRRISEVVTSLKGLVNSETISVLAATSLLFSFLR
jgi:hypothetical protein